MFERAQQFLISKGWLKEHLTMQRGGRARAGHGRRRGRPRSLGAVGNVAGGIFGIVTILILTFYMLVDSWTLRESGAAAVSRASIARASTRPAAR